MEEQIKNKPDLVDMAKKRRHLHLVEKLAKGKSTTPTLSKTEIRELENLEGDPNSPGIVDSQEKIAKIFGVATRTVERWIREGMPVTRDKKYDLLDIRAWRTLKKDKKGKVKKNEVETWDARFRRAKALMAEAELKKTEGLLIEKSEVEKELARVSIGVKRSLLAIPNQVSPQLVGLDVRSINVLLTERINEIITEIHDGKIFLRKLEKLKSADNDQYTENLDTDSP